MTANAFVQELGAANHRAAIRRADDARSALDLYIVLRSYFVLGLYSEAEKALQENQSQLTSFLHRFLELQGRIYHRRNLDIAKADLRALSRELPEDKYLRAEYHFVCGYLHNLMDDYKEGVVQHIAAAALYREEGLKSFECQALFNLCVAHNHLNERRKLDETFLLLKEISEKHPNNTTRLFYLRMHLYRRVDAEDFSEAMTLIEELLGICRREGRWRDLGGMLCLKAYVAIAMGKFDEFDEVVGYAKSVRMALPTEHQRVLEEYVYIQQSTLGERAEILLMIQKWKKQDIDSVHYLFLLSVLAERVRSLGEYELLVNVAQQGNQFALGRHQALSLVDFRKFQVEGLTRLGRFHRASILLSAYRADAIEQKAIVKLREADRLQKELQQIQRWRLKKTSHPNSLGTLFIDSASRKIKFRDRELDLKSRPMVYRLIAHLARTRTNHPIPDLFEQIYGVAFDRAKHQSRFNSLLDRTRVLLGDNRVLERQLGLVGFTRDLSVILKDGNLAEPEPPSRRDAIALRIRDSKEPITISILERDFECTRRSIQLDLKYLLASGRIFTTGGTKNRRYFCEGST